MRLMQIELMYVHENVIYPSPRCRRRRSRRL